jgi:ATP-dependent RNA helicase DDX19/DBP5
MSSSEDPKTTSEESATESDAPEDTSKQEETKKEEPTASEKEEEPTPEEQEKKEDAGELTRRLQKLALERQKENPHERLKVIQADNTSHLSSVKTFQELNLPSHLLDAVFAMGFDRPSAIQEEALPRILAEPPRNIIGQAQSGSGKTAAFVLGILYRIRVNSPATTQALCVTPTRELAVQIFQKAVAPMAANMTGLKVQLALAGEFLGRGEKVDAHVVIGTPGKVVDWIKRKTIKTDAIKVFVLDEADDMVREGGHRANSLLIKKQLPKTCQCLFFSATFPPDVISFADKMVQNPDKILIEAGPEFLVSWGSDDVFSCVVLFFQVLTVFYS